jgi:hypothetical protein
MEVTQVTHMRALSSSSSSSSSRLLEDKHSSCYLQKAFVGHP